MRIRNINNNYAWRYKKLGDHTSLKTRLQSRRFLFFIILCISGFVILINTISIEQFKFTSFTNFSYVDNSINSIPEQNSLIPNLKSAYLIHTNGCRIPYLDPADPDINQRFIRENISIVCDPKYPPRLVESNDTAIFINHYYFDELVEVDCCWTPFWRTEDKDNDVTYDRTCNLFKDSAVIEDEFIQVSCYKKSKPWYYAGFQKKAIIYQDYFAFVPRKPLVEERCHKAQSVATRNNTPSILMVGLDSVSRVNFHRQMPKTAQALRQLGAIEMLGYNKVAYNTYPNVVAVLSGYSQEEIKEICWKDNYQTFDDCPLLWKNFSEAGYRTVFGEDACDMTIFNFMKLGFTKPPTDYYLRPYCLATEGNIGNTHKLNADLCVGSVLTFANLLEYTRKIAIKFQADPYFAFFWQSSLTHDFFDYPRFGDDNYSDFLQYLEKEQLLRNTALIFMSDHGIRWGSFRQTYEGKLEESLPFMFLVLPNWWSAKYPTAVENLKRNAHRLTTPFDLHETLVDLFNPERLIVSPAPYSTDNPRNNQTIPRGISWFQVVPESRNCESAGIPEHYCTCHKAQSVSLTNPEVTHSINFLVNEVNGMLIKYPSCATLKLNRVIDAKIWSTDSEESKKSSWFDYTLTIETVPGFAIFEGTVRYAKGANRTILGSVSRLNSYGKQSACVDDFNMRLYCYCL